MSEENLEKQLKTLIAIRLHTKKTKVIRNLFLIFFVVFLPILLIVISQIVVCKNQNSKYTIKQCLTNEFRYAKKCIGVK